MGLVCTNDTCKRGSDKDIVIQLDKPTIWEQ